MKTNNRILAALLCLLLTLASLSSAFAEEGGELYLPSIETVNPGEIEFVDAEEGVSLYICADKSTAANCIADHIDALESYGFKSEDMKTDTDEEAGIAYFYLPTYDGDAEIRKVAFDDTYVGYIIYGVIVDDDGVYVAVSAADGIAFKSEEEASTLVLPSLDMFASGILEPVESTDEYAFLYVGSDVEESVNVIVKHAAALSEYGFDFDSIEMIPMPDEGDEIFNFIFLPVYNGDANLHPEHLLTCSTPCYVLYGIAALEDGVLVAVETAHGITMESETPAPKLEIPGLTAVRDGELEFLAVQTGAVAYESPSEELALAYIIDHIILMNENGFGGVMVYDEPDDERSRYFCLTEYRGDEAISKSDIYGLSAYIIYETYRYDDGTTRVILIVDPDSISFDDLPVENP